MATVAILTQSFPFPPGEQFLELEIGYWANRGCGVVVLPLYASDEPRPVPSGVLVDTSLSTSRSATRWIRAAFSTAFSPLFRRELRQLFALRKLRPRAILSVARETARALLHARLLGKAAAAHGGFDIVYAYWNDVHAYAAVLHARANDGVRVVGRAHGYDVYEDHYRTSGYMPLKRQLVPEMAYVGAVSNATRSYLVETFGLPRERVHVSRLGVEVPAAPRPTDAREDVVRLLSVSYCMPEKRLDRIVEVVARVARGIPGASVTWTHVGGGPLFKDLETWAATALGPLSNVDYELTGPLDHDEVLKLLDSRTFDLIVNLSDTEGVPVSLMEAMSRGIPVAATDVGGVAELVSSSWGRLLPPASKPDAMAEEILRFLPEAKRPATRELAWRHIHEKFNAESNYPSFVSAVLASDVGRPQ